jgi:hypothetical protein
MHTDFFRRAVPVVTAGRAPEFLPADFVICAAGFEKSALPAPRRCEMFSAQHERI